MTLDYSGAGETTDDGAPLDLPTLARQVAAVAEAVGAPHVDLVGHSLGAAIATVLAAERPELVRTLTLVAGFLTADEPRLKLTFELWRRLIAADREGFIQLIALTTLSDKFFASPLAAHLDALAQGILRHELGGSGAAGGARSAGRHPRGSRPGLVPDARGRMRPRSDRHPHSRSL